MGFYIVFQLSRFLPHLLIAECIVLSEWQLYVLLKVLYTAYEFVTLSLFQFYQTFSDSLYWHSQGHERWAQRTKPIGLAGNATNWLKQDRSTFISSTGDNVDSSARSITVFFQKKEKARCRLRHWKSWLIDFLAVCACRLQALLP